MMTFKCKECGENIPTTGDFADGATCVDCYEKQIAELTAVIDALTRIIENAMGSARNEDKTSWWIKWRK